MLHSTGTTEHDLLLVEAGGWRARQALRAVGESLRRRGVLVHYWSVPDEDEASVEHAEELWRLVRQARIVVLGTGSTFALSAAVAAFRHAIEADPPLAVSQADPNGGFPQPPRDARIALAEASVVPIELHNLEPAVLRTLGRHAGTRASATPARALPHAVDVGDIRVRPLPHGWMPDVRMRSGFVEAQRSFVAGGVEEINSVLEAMAAMYPNGGPPHEFQVIRESRLLLAAVAWLPEPVVADLSDTAWTFLSDPATRHQTMLAAIAGRGGAMLARYLDTPGRRADAQDFLTAMDDPTEVAARTDRLYMDITGARGDGDLPKAPGAPAITSSDLALLWAGKTRLDDPIRGTIFASSLHRTSFWLAATQHRSLPNAVEQVSARVWGRAWASASARLAVRSLIGLHLPESDDDVMAWRRVLVAAKSNRLRVSLVLGIMEWPVIPVAIGETILALGADRLGDNLMRVLPVFLRSRSPGGEVANLPDANHIIGRPGR